MTDAPLRKKPRTAPKKPPNPKNRGTGTKPTALVKRAADLFIKQALTGKYKPIEDTLLEAGYSSDSARQISNVMAGIRPHVDPVIEKLERHRERVMARMESAVEKASYGELTRSLDITTKNIRLLGGKSTHNFAVIHQRRRELDQLLEDDALHETDEGED